MRFLTTGNLPTSIKGFNREFAAVTRVRVEGGPDSWRFTAGCGVEKLFRAKYFLDPHGAAMKALENHRHNA